LRCDLEKYFGSISATLPLRSTEEIVLTREILPQIPLHLVTGRVLVQVLKHEYSLTGRKLISVDSVHLYATKQTYRNLGLFLISLALHKVAVARDLRVLAFPTGFAHLIARRGGPTQLRRIVYSPNAMLRHPYSRPKRAPRAPIRVRVGTRIRKPVVHGFGAIEATIEFAKMLLDFGNPESRHEPEVNLERDIGVRGVSETSAELTLLQPGFYGWDAVVRNRF
jgi:hypothetical protein